MELDLILAIRGAGGVMLCVAASNVPAARILRYRESLASVPAIVREIFHVQHAFIIATLVGLAGACLVFPADLAGGTALGRAMSGYLALFWSARLGVQLFVYDAESKRRFPVVNALFTVAFVYLVVVFGLAASGV